MLVSVITPTYNQAEYLDETIKSILNQDYSHIEYFILDDGSNDNTYIIVKKYLPRLNYCYHENIGEKFSQIDTIAEIK